MQVRCPSCQTSVDVENTMLDSAVSCETCGTVIELVNSDETTDFIVDQPGARIDHFELIEQVGKGSYGTVWKAHDTRLEREVALKIPRRELLNSTEVDQFYREAKAAGQLQHPNIVRVYEVGRTEHAVYMVSDFIDGVTLAEWLTAGHRDPHDAARLIVKIADALHHAHQSGIIHRDVKPSNIILDQDGEPYVMDFGLAKRETSDESMTIAGYVMGTPSYISPEQARGEARQADRRTDIYSLGVVLFELLTGEKPFRGSRRMLLHQAMYDDAPSTRKFNNSVPRDLDTVCLKCLEKSPHQRYSTALQLKEELERFLRGEPIVARPIGRVSRVARWCQRNVAVASLLTVLVITFLAGFAGVTTQWLRANHNAELAAESAEDAQRAAANERTAHNTTARHLYIAHMNMVQRAYESGNPDRAIELLQQYLPDIAPGLAKLRSFEWFYWWDLCHRHKRNLTGHTGPVYSCAVNSDGTLVASGGKDGSLHIWNVESGKRIGTLVDQNQKTAHQGAIFGLSFSPQNKLLVSAGRDHKIRIWDVAKKALLQTLSTHSGFVFDVALRELSGGKLLLASASADRTVRLFQVDADTGKATTGAVLAEGTETDHSSGHFDRVHGVDISPDGKWIVSGGLDRQLIVWTPGKPPRRYSTHEVEVLDVAISTDGKLIASASGDRTVRVWRVGAELEVVAVFRHADRVFSVEFSPDGTSLMSAGMGRIVKIWDVNGLAEVKPKSPITRKRNRPQDFFLERQPKDRLQQSFAGHSGPIYAARFSADGRHIVSVSADGLTKVWPVSARHNQVLSGHTRVVNSVAFAQNETSRWFVSGSSDGTARIWDIDNGLKLGRPFPHGAATADRPGIFAVAVPKSSDMIAWGCRGGRLFIQHLVPGGTPIELLDGKAAHAKTIASIAFSPTDGLMASASHDGTVKLWDVTERTLVQTLKKHRGRVQAVRFSPDGKVFATAGADATCLIWARKDSTATVVHRLTGHAGKIWSVEFSPDSQRLATGSRDKTIRLWNVATGQFERLFKGHARDVLCVAFAPDGRTLASGSMDKTVHLWDLSTGESKTMLSGHSYYIWSLAFSHDGTTLATSGVELRLWRAGGKGDRQ